MNAGATGRSWWGRANRFLGTGAAGAIMLIALAVLYLAAYRGDELNPGASLPAERRGWWSWADQTKYVEAAEAMAHGRLEATSYLFPLGYSALAAPFVRWMPAQPFLLPDLGCVLLTVVFAWRLARRWLSPAGVWG